jgi:hypothetical protein
MCSVICSPETESKFKLTHHSELYSWPMQSVLSPGQEPSLCEIFDSSLTWASPHSCITCQGISIQMKRDARQVGMIMKLTFVRNHLVGIQGPIQNQ